MLTYDKDNQMQKDFDYLEFVCTSWMEHYNFLLSLPYNTDADKLFYQDHFNQMKWYDV
jgi:hypothetical protein